MNHPSVEREENKCTTITSGRVGLRLLVEAAFQFFKLQKKTCLNLRFTIHFLLPPDLVLILIIAEELVERRFCVVWLPPCGVEAVLVHTLHITGFGLSSLSIAVAGLAMATTTSGFRHFILPPISAANWLCSISKLAANLPTLADTHSSQTARKTKYLRGKGKIWIAIS